jgi:hypothetical protein
MIANWFFAELPPSRFVIEGELRNVLWKAGVSGMWLSCTRENVPYECAGVWRGSEFTIEWDPKTHFLLKTKEPNAELLDLFERTLNHKALAAYKESGAVVVEWRAKNADERFKELQSNNVTDLERLK